MGQFHVGARGELTLLVTEADTAVAHGSGDVPVLATPRVVALVEEATVLAIAHELADGQTTVGMRVQLDHVQPTAVGTIVTAEAVLEKVEGRRLVFHVTVTDPFGLAATGRITRVLVDRSRFLDRLADDAS
jgi:fluoroacetyl-CoA thioesterase